MRKLSLMGALCSLLLVAHPISASFQEQSKIETKVEVSVKPIPYDVKYVFNRDMGQGRMKKVVNGVKGEEKTTLTHTIVDGEIIKTDKKVEVTDPKAAVFHMGKTGFTSSRGSFSRKNVKTMEATAYLPTDGGGHGITATGRSAKYGVVAVDPRVIPLNSLVFVEGYGFAVAADTGGAIKGNKIDLCMHSRSEAMKFGRRKVVVHVFQEMEPKYRRKR